MAGRHSTNESGEPGSPGPAERKGAAARIEPLRETRWGTVNPDNLSTKRQWISEQGRHPSQRYMIAIGNAGQLLIILLQCSVVIAVTNYNDPNAWRVPDANLREFVLLSDMAQRQGQALPACRAHPATPARAAWRQTFIVEVR
jgi:hypothetical protein